MNSPIIVTWNVSFATIAFTSLKFILNPTLERGKVDNPSPSLG
jgi:hypothetical protein